jgi:AAA family ATP:ADP antiporter
MSLFKNFVQKNFYHDNKPLMDKTGVFIFFCYFMALFSYPLVRSATGALFYEAYTAQDYPFATFVTVVALGVVITISNRLQKLWGIHKLYVGMSLLSILLLLASMLLFNQGHKIFAYVMFATKEIYIVLLIHLCLAFANGHFSLLQVKKLYGPMGAFGSIGGIVGGQLTANIAKNHGTEPVVYISLVAIFFTAVAFYQTRHAHLNEKKPVFIVTPLKAIKNVTRYVVLIALIVALSQMVIFIADLQFNLVFEKVVESKNERTAYLGKIYSYVNVGTLFLQFIVLPVILTRFKTRSILYFIPVLYLFLIFAGLGLGASTLWVVAGVFISMKATDYSLFSVAKEILYHPLKPIQKYGAKYITDIFVYRMAKGSIALGLSAVAIKTMTLLNTLQTISISLWLFVIFLIFQEQRRLKIEEE